MAKKATKQKRSPSASIVTGKTSKPWNGLPGWEFTIGDFTYWVNAYAEAGSLATVRLERSAGTYVIDAYEEVPGKKKPKGVTMPLTEWLGKFARVV